MAEVKKLEKTKKADPPGSGSSAPPRAELGKAAARAGAPPSEAPPQQDKLPDPRPNIPKPGREARQNKDTRVIDFNVAGGHDTLDENFEGKTSEHLAKTMVEEGADVATLQEVSVKKHEDYPAEILEDLAEESLPEGYKVDEENARYYGADGKEITDPEEFHKASRIAYTAGKGEDMDQDPLPFEINKQWIEVPLEGSDPPETREAIVYTSELNGEESYSAVFGSSTKHGYGNAVVLAPGNELIDPATGTVRPGAIHIGLVGTDPKPEDGEPRTALGVTAKVDGKTTNVISAHFTNKGSAVDDDGNPVDPDYLRRRRDAIREQYGTLNQFADDWYKKKDTIIGGDLNSVPGGEALSEDDPNYDDDEERFPTLDRFGWLSGELRGIDQVFTTPDLAISETDPRGPVSELTPEEEGGSDHRLFIRDIER